MLGCRGARKQCQTCICTTCGIIAFNDPCAYSKQKGCPGAYSVGGCAGFTDKPPCEENIAKQDNEALQRIQNLQKTTMCGMVK